MSRVRTLDCADAPEIAQQVVADGFTMPAGQDQDMLTLYLATCLALQAPTDDAAGMLTSRDEQRQLHRALVTTAALVREIRLSEGSLELDLARRSQIVGAMQSLQRFGYWLTERYNTPAELAWYRAAQSDPDRRAENPGLYQDMLRWHTEQTSP